MSKWFYLECAAHEPRLRSEDVGQHTYDLEHVREIVANRDAFVTVARIVTDPNLGAVDHFTGHAVSFLMQHPTCPLALVDEYGEHHPLKEEPK